MYKIVYNAGSRCLCVYVCVSVFLEERGNWNYFQLPIFTFPSKRQRKDVTSVHRSCNSVNSTRLYNLEVMTKMSIIIAIMLTSNLIFKKKCRTKLYFKNTKFLNFLVLISTKFIIQNLPKINDEIF